MPDIASRKFVETFQHAFAKSGRLSETDLKALTAAQGKITNATDRAAAQSVMAMIKHDKELDAFEVAPMKKALGVLVGVTHGALPADLEKALERGVPQANVNVKHYELSFDVSGKGPDFPARALVEFEAKAKGVQPPSTLPRG